jgi:PAS domain-containing protein
MVLRFGQTTEEIPMVETTILVAILDSLKDPVLFADTEHVTRYMNQAAIAYYEEGEALIGRSLLDCHNERSRQMMIEILAAMQVEGLEEQLITDNAEHRIYMRAVRDADGRVLGYYERYEPPSEQEEK